MIKLSKWGDSMKKTVAFLFAVLMLLCLIACEESEGLASSELSSSVWTESSEPSSEDINTSLDTSSGEISSIEVSSVTPSSEASSSKPVSSKTSSGTSSKQNSSKVTSSTPKNTDVKVEKYTVTDPENKRGLSNKKYGFGFGVAKDGRPHSISVDNQARFDKLSGVKALALDTKSTDKRMYLTFDCGYEYKNLTADILDTLKEKKVKAAFFLTLSYIKNNPELVRRMINEGHIVGNHSATHPSFPDISRSKMAEEIYLVDEYLQKNFGYKSDYFRFPAGENSENSLELVSSIGYKSVFWSLAYADYDTSKQVGYDAAFKTVTDRFHSGAVILLHAVSKDNADILPAVIDRARQEGYSFKSLDDYYK